MLGHTFLVRSMLVLNERLSYYLRDNWEILIFLLLQKLLYLRKWHALEYRKLIRTTDKAHVTVSCCKKPQLPRFFVAKKHVFEANTQIFVPYQSIYNWRRLQVITWQITKWKPQTKLYYHVKGSTWCPLYNRNLLYLYLLWIRSYMLI